MWISIWFLVATTANFVEFVEAVKGDGKNGSKKSKNFVSTMASKLCSKGMEGCSTSGYERLKKVKLSDEDLQDVEALPHSHPSLISLRKDLINTGHCTAALIRAKPEEDKTDVAIASADCANYNGLTAVIGAHDANSSGLRIPVAHVYKHRKRKGFVGMDYNIAIVLLSESVTFNGHTIQPAELAKQDEKVTPKMKGVIAGWSWWKDSNIHYNDRDLLREAVVEIVRPSESTVMQKQLVEARHISVRGLINRGPELYQTWFSVPLFTERENRRILSGIASTWDYFSKGKEPAIFTRVSYFVKNGWIDSTVKKVSSFWTKTPPTESAL